MSRERLVDIFQVTKRYKNSQVLTDVTFSIAKGEICGLVGENGAGKTTLLRILSGLISQTSGNIKGMSTKKIGSIIETPALYPNLTGYENLTYIKKLMGINRDVNEVLKLVDLNQVDRQKKVKDYSLGMRQRLAIAIAIMDNPELLILDEPVNGLDPKGIKELRDLILNLKNQLNITILISSHILSELSMVADKYIIMKKGKVIKEISTDELTNVLRKQLYISTSNNATLKKSLEKQGVFVQEHEKYLVTESSDMDTMMIIEDALGLGLSIEEIFNKKLDVETYYLQLTT